MTEQEIQKMLEEQRRYFRSGATLSLQRRQAALGCLKECIRMREGEIQEALGKDLGKSGFESYMCEIGMVLSEITYMQRHLRSLSREKRVGTPLAQFPSRSFRKPSPCGQALIMSPWNYPFLLTLDPLVDALAAGNTAVLKPSAYSPHTSALIESMMKECFPPEYVAVVTGGRMENTCLLEQKFDLIFFTGSQRVGREVMRKAAEHLTPVILELGGKSPCIVEKSADIPLAAKRIAFGKFLNCGQTCVAPDYIYCDRSVKEELVKELARQIRRQYGENPLENADYGKIINEKHFDRILRLIDAEKLVWGGRSDRASLKIEPAVLDGADWSDPVMKEEIFGPVLPILAYDSLEEAIAAIEDRPHPLALYLFTRSRKAARQVFSRCRFGGGCLNDVVIHLATSEMGFGGFGESGMGAYHGKAGFDAFSHYKSMVDKKLWLDLPMRYQPYRAFYEKLIRNFLR